MKNQVLLIAILSIVIGTTIKAQTCSIVKSVGKNTYLIEVGEVFTTIYNQNDLYVYLIAIMSGII